MNNAAGRDSVKVTVKPLSTAAANIATRDTTIFAGASVLLSDLANAVGVSNPQLKWYTTLNGNTAVSSLTVSPQVTTTYYVSVEGSDYCQGDRDSVVITVKTAVALRGTVFPFVHFPILPEYDPVTKSMIEEWTDGFMIHASLYSYPTGDPGNTIAEIMDGTASPVATVKTKYYHDVYIPGTPKNGGVIGQYNNPGLPIAWDEFGQTPGQVDNRVMSEQDNIPEVTEGSTIGYFEFTDIEPNKKYVLALSRAGFITRFATIEVQSGDMSLGHRELIGGDVNGDLMITSADVSNIQENMCGYGDPKYEYKRDIYATLYIGSSVVTLLQEKYLNFFWYYYLDTRACILGY